jgi:hypothetical protein
MLEVGAVDIFQLFLMEPPKAQRVEGCQDHRLLVVALDLLHLAPLSRLLHRLDFRVCDECLVSLVEPGVVWHLEFGVGLRRVHRHGLRWL